MLVSSFSTINITSYNYNKILKAYGNKLNVYLDKMLQIPVDLLPKGSSYKVILKCDYCFKEYSSEWRKYNNEKKDCCGSKECVSKKRKETNLDKWGVDNPMKNKEIKKRLSNTIFNKYGVKYYSKTDEYKEKVKNSSLDKWGVDHYFKTNEYKEKFKENSLDKWGVENPFQSELIKQKIRNTNIEKYGTDNFSKTKIHKEKVKNTSKSNWGVECYSKTKECKEKTKHYFINKYGVTNPMKIEEIKLKLKNKNLTLWGVDNYTKTEEYKEKTKKTNLRKWGNEVLSSSYIFRNRFYKIANHKDYIKYLENGVSIFYCDYGKKHNFEINSFQYFNRIRQNIPLCTICNPIGDLKSIKENELFKFIKSVYKGEIKQSYRDTLEIDIYLPELKIGFEFNGLYYHSDKFKENSYHLNKSIYFKEKGIRIIHIWEDDWDFRKNIIKSQIKNWLGFSKRIWARNCVVYEIKDPKIATEFLNKNHIKGCANSSLKLGLYYKLELVGIMTFDHYEDGKKISKNEWNINRFCNILNTSVIGGASKLLNHFINNYDINRIISYVDRDWSDGNLYEKIGFSKISDTKTDYKYLIDGVRIHKSNYRKPKIGISEKNIDTLRVWDCGKIKYEKIINF